MGGLYTGLALATMLVLSFQLLTYLQGRFIYHRAIRDRLGNTMEWREVARSRATSGCWRGQLGRVKYEQDIAYLA